MVREHLDFCAPPFRGGGGWTPEDLWSACRVRTGRNDGAQCRVRLDRQAGVAAWGHCQEADMD